MFSPLLRSSNMFAAYWFCCYDPYALGSWCARRTAHLSPGTTQRLMNYLFFLPFFCLFSSSFPFLCIFFSLFSDSFSSLEEAFLSLSLPSPSFFPSLLFIRWFFLLEALLCGGQSSSSSLSFSSSFFCDFFLSSLFALTISLRVCFLDLLSFTSSSARDKKKNKPKPMKQQALWETAFCADTKRIHQRSAIRMPGANPREVSVQAPIYFGELCIMPCPRPHPAAF